jgi:SAM-dependent methyltransferase
VNVATGVAETRRPPPPEPLMRRYRPEDLAVLTPQERERWISPFVADATDADEVRRAWPAIRPALAWELLYRLEPDLYERLIAGERIHSGIVARLPRVGRAVEVGAGSGRLTVALARRARHVIAVEPAAPLRRRLAARLEAAGLRNVDIVSGFFDELPMPGDSADLVVACSAFTVEPGHGGRAGLEEMERVCRPGGAVAIVWPDAPEWLVERGYTHEVFDGEAEVVFGSVLEAVAVARIFYPDAVPAIEAAGTAAVPYSVLGRRRPQELCWKRMGS